MKKIIALFLIALLALSLFGCTAGTPGGNSDDPAAPTEAPTEAPTAEPTAAPTTAQPDTAALESAMRELFDKNLDCMLNIYDLRTLECEDEPIKDSLYRVTDDRFKSFADLETYTRSVYVDAEAKRLLFEPRFGDHTLYQDVDGVFCIDYAAMGGRGYYVDWTDYTLTVDEATDTTCHFTLIAKEEAPGDPPVISDRVSKAVAVKQNGEWRLEKAVD